MEISSNTFRPLHILVVDRDQSIRELLQALYLSHGDSVSCAREQVEALRLVKPKVPDVIFSSLIFEGMDGLELCRQLRATPKTVNKFIVALTGSWSSGIEEPIFGAGFDRCLLKPVTMQLLLSLLDMVKKP